MAYVPDWERLSDALKRFTVAGFARKKAKIIICGLIGNKTFRIRTTTVAPATNPAAKIIEDWNQTILGVKGLTHSDAHVRSNKRTGPLEVGDSFEGANIKIPSHLAPEDFDWAKSRPWKPWLIGPREWKSEERHSFSWHYRPISLIEVRTIDVITWIETDSVTGGEKPNHARNERRRISRGAKTRGITQAIDELWPDGIPTGLAAKERNRAILARMVDKGSSIPKAPERAIQRVLKTRRTK